jgi:hypothetical protein
VIAVVDALEQEAALEAAAAREKAAAAKPTSVIDLARRAAFVTRLAYDKMGRPMPDNFHDAMMGLLEDQPEAEDATKTTKDGGT